MQTEKTFSVILFILFGILVTISIGLYIWAGVETIHSFSVKSIVEKVSCSLVLDILSVPLLIWGLKLIKPTSPAIKSDI